MLGRPLCSALPDRNLCSPLRSSPDSTTRGIGRLRACRRAHDGQICSRWRLDSACSCLARANLVAEVSNTESERVWSLADYAGGGDRASISSEMLNARLILKKNMLMWSELAGQSVFEMPHE